MKFLLNLRGVALELLLGLLSRRLTPFTMVSSTSTSTSSTWIHRQQVHITSPTFQLYTLSFLPTAVAAHLALYKFNLKTCPPSPFNPSLKEPIKDKVTFNPVPSS